MPPPAPAVPPAPREGLASILRPFQPQAMPLSAPMGGGNGAPAAANGNDALMVRPDAKMDGSKPISGGIPFCFPQVNLHD